MFKKFLNRLSVIVLCSSMIMQGIPLSVRAEDTQSVTKEEPAAEPSIASHDGGDIVWVEDECSLYQDGALYVDTLPESAPKRRQIYTVGDVSETEKIQKYIYEQLTKRTETIDVSNYGILVEDINAIYSSVVNEHPELYYVNRVSWSYNPSTMYVSRLNVTYTDGFDDVAFAQATRQALSGITDDMSDMEKAIVLHDYLDVNCQYNTAMDNPHRYSAYGALVDQLAVCNGYALAYKYLLNQVGIECLMVSSKELNHAWNMVKLNGEYYQVDTTWDDPINDRLGRARHFYMFVSDASFREERKHDATDWQITKNGYTVDVTATDTQYDDYFWKDLDTPFVLDGDACYYISSSGGIVQGDLQGNVSKKLNSSIGRWPVWGGGGNWIGTFSGFFSLGDRLYYNKTDGLYSISKDGTDDKKVYAVDTTSGYVYGSALVYNCAENRYQVKYLVGTTPNLTGDEPIYEATLTDVELPELVPEPEPKPEVAPKAPVLVVSGASLETESGLLVDEGISVAIEAESDAEVYYTTDGSAPAYGGNLYAAPITVNENITIRALAYRGGLSSGISEETYVVADNELILSDTEISMKKGEERQLSAVKLPTTKTAADIIWSSTAGSVAAVTSSGTVSAVSEGQATITATVTDWQGRTVTADCKVTVEASELDPEPEPEPEPEPAQEYTVTFIGFGNEIIKTETVKEGESATAPVPPEILGYRFTGWSGNYTKVTQNETVTAQYTPILYTITYVLAGGVNGDNPDSYTIESRDITLLDASGKSGYVFAGWYDNEEYTGVPVKTIAQGTTGNITLYARWKNERELWMQWDGVGEGEDCILEYAGSALKPAFTVYYGDDELQPGTDYTVTYKNNVKVWQTVKAEKELTDAERAKAPSVIIKGKGNYTGTVTAVFQIAPKSITAEDVEAYDIAVAYNKKVQKPVPAVKWGKITLKNKKDFTVSYPDEEKQGAYQEPKEYKIRVTGMGNFCGETEITLTIVKTDTKDETAARLMSKAKVTAVLAQEYTGKAVRLETQGLPVVKYGKETLIEGVHYKLIYGNDCVEVGTYPLTIKGIGQYVGEVHTTFQIKGIAASTMKVTGIDNQIYDGSAKEPEPTITDKEGNSLKKGVDYTLDYDNNVEVGTAKLTITGMGKYSGTVKKTFKITALSLEDIPAGRLEVRFAQGTASTQPYEKGGAKPKLLISYRYTDAEGKSQSIALQEGVHYSPSYKNNTTVSPKEGKEPYILINGKKNFRGSLKVDFKIIPADISKVRMTAPDVQENTKAGKFYSTPVLTDANGKKLVKGTDYEATFSYKSQNGVELGKEAKPVAGTVITVIVTGKGNYTGTNQTTYRIFERGKNISSAKVKVLSPVYYTGDPVTLSKSNLEVTLGGKVLESEDYEIVSSSYVNNVKKGTAKVTIRGRGEYAGTKTISFKIQAQSMKWWDLLGNIF